MKRFILPVIASAGIAGSLLAGTAVSLAATSAPAVVAAAPAHAVHPDFVYHG